MDFKTLLKKDFVIADGAQGTELRRLYSEPVDSPDDLNFIAPETVKQVARSYAESGSDIVCANTFSINRFNLKKSGKTVDQAIEQALKITKDALSGFNTLTALDVSTLGKLLEPSGTLKFEEAYDIYKEIMTAGERHGADLVIIETMTDLYETKAALLALKENTNLPVICSMTFEQNGRTFTGCPVSCMALTLEGLGADALGINCSLGPEEVAPMVKELLEYTNLPVMVKPNAGLPDPVTNEFPLSAADFGVQMADYARMGVKILGGCCGTSPEFIKRLCENIKDIKPERKEVKRRFIICGASKAVEIDRPRIIGERLNPTGKKLLKQALLDNDSGYILSQAVEQINAGADILDVNVGAAGIDEVKTLPQVVKAVQSVAQIPLQLDSANPAALEAALRVYNGKAIVNSVNADEESLNAVLPLVKKYGAAVVGLTLDKNGIPKSAQGRFELAEKILERALGFGIRREDVYIDCLTLTAGAEQESAAETLKAVRLVKEKLGLKTALGVSNISFGLPERGVINRTFLALALENGLDLPIINPNDRDMTDTVRAFNVLSGIDKNAAEYVSSASNQNQQISTAEKAAVTLEYAVLNGLKADAAELTRKKLEDTPPMEVVNNELIPALDKAGALFGEGKLFLPQLMLSAESAGACFDIIKRAFGDSAKTSEKKIILATVKGDIHDIGKNIVKVLLENYGYNVIDLGKDVPPEAVLESALKSGAKLVGLSALMTLTLPAMEETTRLLKEKTDCKIMVGGAVLTAEYAEKIGADFYGKDARAAVEIAAKNFN